MGKVNHQSHQHNAISGKNLLISIILNIVITLSQVIGGFISGSLALLSDALHNFTDVVSLVISYIANRLSKQKASTHRTFGYKRAEIIAAFINGVTLVVIAILLIIESVKRFLEPHEIASELVIWLSLLGIIANGLSVFILKKDADKNINMRSAYLHLLTDMLASVAVFIGGLLMKYYQVYWVDSLLTFIIAVYLVYVGFDLLKESTKMLMLFTPDSVDVKAVARAVHQIPKVNKLHHIHIWCLNDDEMHLEAHLDFKENIDLYEFNHILHQIEELLKTDFGINHVNIQPEFKKDDPKDFIVQD
ncbi:cobalt-zinc-cadmium efflux system protein [Zhouia amylolytica]|uniref:Cation diffusion facilitator family transporter n=2 Tax=Zhouia amylolytica TaxID=376730 RepID=W2UJ57_9FLAO|nr:cation diffusion facilitator family transporter [Zhouia amylolytica]ETN94048.1 cation diffusion facilitator family transporter [Zhouia amylolytica AD3]MCQ0112940.1 cation transporter [Zhouia amylolytica]SFS43285.1 cobalt-zinc-cadmium efflux system protein [Zhouia amylolytica]